MIKEWPRGQRRGRKNNLLLLKVHKLQYRWPVKNISFMKIRPLLIIIEKYKTKISERYKEWKLTKLKKYYNNGYLTFLSLLVAWGRDLGLPLFAPLRDYLEPPENRTIPTFYTILFYRILVYRGVPVNFFIPTEENSFIIGFFSPPTLFRLSFSDTISSWWWLRIVTLMVAVEPEWSNKLWRILNLLNLEYVQV